MIAGTLVQLEDPADERLNSTFGDGDRLPALEVSSTQSSFDDRPIQRGTAAGTVQESFQEVFVSEDNDGDCRVVTEPEERHTTVATDWVADVTGTGLIAIESIQGPGEFDFPLDLFAARTDRRPQRLEVDVEKLHMAWDDDGVLGDVWMRGADAGDGASIDYHQRANAEEPATIGFGFERPWNGTIMEGVVYESGYVAAYNESRPTQFIRFVEEEMLPYAEVPDESSAAQTTLGDDSDPECEECGRETDSVDDTGLCVVCRDKQEEDAEGEEFGNLDTVHVADGGDEA
jgi:hypothetical protein